MRPAKICSLALVTLVGCAEPQEAREEKSQLESAFETPADHERKHRQERLDLASKALSDERPYALIDEDYFREESVFDYVQRIKAHVARADADPRATAFVLKWAGVFVFETDGPKKGRTFYIYESVTALKGIGGKVIGDRTIVWLAPIGQCTANPVLDDALECSAHDERKGNVVLYTEEQPKDE
jgi:hypothetical protein